MIEQWRADCLRALDEAREMILAEAGPTFLAVTVVSEADLLGDRPVSFFANLNPDAMGSFLTYCGQRWIAMRKIMLGER